MGLMFKMVTSPDLFISPASMASVAFHEAMV